MSLRIRVIALMAVVALAAAYAVLCRRTEPAGLDGPPGGSRLIIEPEAVDLGEVKPSRLHEVTFTFRNPTRHPIQVLKVAARCGCIEGPPSLPTVPADGERPFTLRYRSRPDRARDNSRIEFWTDETAESKAFLRIASQANPVIVAEPEVLDFGEMKPGERKELALTLRHLKGAAFKVLKVTSGGGEFAASAAVEEGGDGSRWRVKASCEGGARGVVLRQGALAQTDCEDAPTISFNLVATLVGNIDASPRALTGKLKADGRLEPWVVSLRRVTAGRIKVTGVKETGLRPVAYEASDDGEAVKLTLSFKDPLPTDKSLSGIFVILVENEPAPLNIPYQVQALRAQSLPQGTVKPRAAP
jgi:hypothetical protein